jgi:NADPH:quinone reductase-like Zn-dependent oxidoreductase
MPNRIRRFCYELYCKASREVQRSTRFKRCNLQAAIDKGSEPLQSRKASKKINALTNSMKIIARHRYGSPEVLALEDAPKPVLKDDEVLIRVRATTVTSGDCRVRALNVPYGFALLSRFVFGLTRPRQPILGTELAGDVEAVGKQVEKFRVGDRVFAFTGMKMGAYAEYVCVAESGMLCAMPDNLSYAQAAALSFGGTTALDFFRRAKLCKGEHVLVIGGSGSVGSAAIQIAKHIGAKVTAVCSQANAELVRKLGADHVIDYTQQDFTHRANEYDVILDTVGATPLSRLKPLLAQSGRLLLVVATLPTMLTAPFVFMGSGRKAIAGPVSERVQDLHELARLANIGAYVPSIDRSYRFDEMANAHRYVDTGRKRGNVIVLLA